MQDILNKFVEEIKNTYKDNLKSVIMYGSKVNFEDTKKYSDYNLLVVLEDIKFNDLKTMNKAIRNWIKHKNQPPLLFTISRLKKSADVFPIEFLDIKDNHKVLFGDDPFIDLEIQGTHLRHECEFELKGKLLKLRQGYMMTLGKSDRIRELMINSISTFLIVFKYVVRMLGEVPPKKRLDALNILAERIGLNPDPFILIFKMKNQDKDALKLEPDSIMEEYLKEIEKVVDFVDNLV